MTSRSPIDDRGVISVLAGTPLDIAATPENPMALAVPSENMIEDYTKRIEVYVIGHLSKNLEKEFNCKGCDHIRR